jgi:hypothetical protein
MFRILKLFCHYLQYSRSFPSSKQEFLQLCFIFFNRSALGKSPIDKQLENGRYLYGVNEPNVERAMKAAAQELVSGNAYWYALQGMDVMISIPMQTFVEFKGN